VVVMMTLYAVYQAFKFMTTDPALAELMRTQPSARSARREAGFYRGRQRSDWFDVNVEVMDVILHAKFTLHEDLREKLLETGNRELIEDSPVRCLGLVSAPFLWTEPRIGRRVLGNWKGWSRA